MAVHRYVCRACNRVKFCAYIPSCDGCYQLMVCNESEPADVPAAEAPRKIERPHDDYTPYAGVFFTCDPLSTDKFEKLMRAAFDNEAGLTGYREVV